MSQLSPDRFDSRIIGRDVSHFAADMAANHVRISDALKGRRVLVVEDDVRNVFALTSILEPRGATVRIARNGREALDLLAAEPCDVIVLDLMMPVMDGAEFKREADRRGITTPVLLVSAGHDTARQARELGAAGHLVKPVDPDDLEAAIARLAH